MQDTLSGQAGAQGSLQGLDARERVPPGVGLEICARGAGKSGRFDPFGRLDGQGGMRFSVRTRHLSRVRESGIIFPRFWLPIRKERGI